MRGGGGWLGQVGWGRDDSGDGSGWGRKKPLRGFGYSPVSHRD